MAEISENNKKIAKNTIFLYIRMGVIMVVNLFSARILLQSLGVEDYGIYNIVAGIITFMVFFTNTMSTANQRFMCYELGQNRMVRVRAILTNGVIVTLLILIFIIFIAQTVGLWLLYNFINIPIGKKHIALIVYQYTIITFSFQFSQIPFHATIISFEKMNIFAIISIADSIIKLLITICIKYFPNRLEVYSLTLCIESFLVFLIYFIICNKKLIKLKFKNYISKRYIETLFKFICYNAFGQLSFISANHGLNILMNIFYGVLINSAMGIANQVNAAVLQFVNNFQTAFRPTLIKTYALKDITLLERQIAATSKISFILLYIVSLPLIVNLDYILNLWLTTVPNYTSEFCLLTIIFSVIEIITGSILILIYATGDIKNYQIVSGIMYLFTLPATFILLLFGISPIYALLPRIVISLFVSIYKIYYSQRITNINGFKFYKTVILKILLIIIITVPTSLYIRSLFPNTFIGICINSLLIIISILLTSYYCGLNVSEKKFVSKLVLKRNN